MASFAQKAKRAEVSEYHRSGCKVLEVDTLKATYQGIPWRTLGSWGRRKYENLLFIENDDAPLKIIYV